MKRNAVVLLAGMDSTAALHWARGQYGAIVAAGCDYGQPHAREELAAAEATAKRVGVPWFRIDIPGLSALDPSAGLASPGVSRAFVPGRNLVMVAHAAALAGRLWPGEYATVVVGCNADDAAGFPDCRAAFLRSLSLAVGASMAGACDVTVASPWVPWLEPSAAMSKAAIVRWAAEHIDPEVLGDLRRSVSCYRGTRCGVCDACTLRARAFAEAGVEEAA